MNIKNKILFLLTKKVLERNKKFENLHKGESCYIFGNGGSLKYFDLKKFNDKISIGCGLLFLHKDFKKINVKYYYTGHPFFYYPYWTDPYSKKIVKNNLGALYKEKILEICQNYDTSFFMSLSNYFGIYGRDIYFVHHFDKLFDDFTNCKLDRNFTSMDAGLSGMLGLAICMGFKDITLVGCDYTFSQQPVGHFYDFGRPHDSSRESFLEPYIEKVILSAIEHVNIRTVTPSEHYRGDTVPHIRYKDLTGDKQEYKENHEIISKSDLLDLSHRGLECYRIFP